MTITNFKEMKKEKDKKRQKFDEMFDFVIGENDVVVKNESIDFNRTYKKGPEFIHDIVNYIYNDGCEDIIEKHYNSNLKHYIVDEKGEYVEGKVNAEKKCILEKDLDNTQIYRKIGESEYYIYVKGSGPDKIGKVTDLLSDYCISKNIELEKFEFIYEQNKTKADEKKAKKAKGEKNMSIYEKIKALIKDGEIHQIILTGAPGTGKTYTAKQIAKSYTNESTKKIFKEKCKSGDIEVNYRLVQFHPSYDYTDFVEGIRPIEGESGMTFKKFDGIFKEFCRKVATENRDNEKSLEQKYFFIIDEINRADLSKVLGELMLGLEKDKRGEDIQTQYSNIKETYIYDEKNSIYKSISGTSDVFTNGFFIPENVVIIGTMNDIDRSVESMDFALRRRFTWVEVDVTEDLLYKAFGIEIEKEQTEDDFKENKFCKSIKKKEDRVEIINRIMALNNVISTLPIKDKNGNIISNTNSIGDELGLNKHYYVSQGYFTGIPNTPETDSMQKLLQWVWDYRLKSLLEEYVRGEDSKNFLKACEDAFLKKSAKDKGTGDKNDLGIDGK